MSSATPDAERTPTEPPARSSAGGSRLRRWRRADETNELAELDEAQAAELVRRSHETERDDEPVSAASAELEDEPDEPEDDGNVIELDRRWAEPAPSAEELAALEARREAAEAAAIAATERVIAQTIATGMTDPDELPEVRRGLLRRKTGYYSPQAPRPVVDPAAVAATSERVQEMRLPRKVRRELERATKEMTDAAAAAYAARTAAEQAAAAHAEQLASAERAAVEAAKGREAAEQAAREQALQARTEAQRRAVAEQLATETAAARAQAEESALRASLEREAAEARALAQAEAAARALEERSAAEARAQELAASLEEARAALLEQTRATLAAQQKQTEAAAPAPARRTPPRTQPAPHPPEPRIQPEGVPELVEFRSPSSSAVVTVLLGLGALVAAGVAVYQAYLDRLTTPPGIAASVVTLFLVVVVGRARGAAGRVWLEQGVLHVEEGDSHRRFDLTTPNTKVEMVGQPGSRRWRVLFLRKGMAPYEVDAGLVDPEAFVDAIRPYRPNLGG